MKALVGEDKVSVARMAAIPATFMTGVRYVKNYDSQRPVMQKVNVLMLLLVDECVNT